MRELYCAEDGKPIDLFTWVYTEDSEGNRKYLAGTAGRMLIPDATAVCAALNEYSLCTGEGR